MMEYRKKKIEDRRERKEKSRGILFFCLFSLLFSTLYLLTSAHATEPTPFDTANAKYQAGDFKAAITLYEDITKASKGTGAVYFNLGNSYFRLNQKGKALIAYERAFRAIPRDKDLLWNMNVLRSVLADRIEPTDENLLFYWIRNIARQFTIDEISLAITAALAWWLLTALLVYFFPVIKGVMKAVRVLIAIFLSAAAVLFWLNWLEIKDPRVVVLDKQVYAHYGPSDRETKAFLLHEGAEAKVTDKSKDWVYVVLKNKNSGWIPERSCETI